MAETNIPKLVKMKVSGSILHPDMWTERSFAVTWDGKPKLTVGIGGIVYNVRVGDPVFGWAADQLNAGVAVGDTDAGRQAALNTYSCIGNTVKVLSGDAKGSKGTVVGKTQHTPGGSRRVIVDFQPETIMKLAIGDKMEVEAWGSGLAFMGHPSVRVMSLSPQLLEKLPLGEAGSSLTVPVVSVLPGALMGAGVGSGIAEQGAWNIQSCSGRLVKKHRLDELRFGDLVAVKDVSSDYGNTVFDGGFIVGVVSHGASDLGGHGPGLSVLLSTQKKNAIKPVMDPGANVGRLLGLRGDKKW